jgi:hypothetical protein
MKQETLEKLADAQHEIWSHWMKYLFTQGWDNPDGSFKVKRPQVEKWKKQMKTSYDGLSGEEKKSDRQVVIKFLAPIIEEIYNEGFNECKQQIKEWNKEIGGTDEQVDGFFRIPR